MTARVQITAQLMRTAHAVLLSRRSVPCADDFDEAIANPIQHRYVRCIAVGMACAQRNKRPPTYHHSRYQPLPKHPTAIDGKRAAAGDIDD